MSTPHTEQADQQLSRTSLTEPLVQPAGTAAKQERHSLKYKKIDDFLDDTIVLVDHPELKYPHFLFSHWRKPAVEKNAHYPFMRQFKLFVDYEGRTWRVIGASSMGDVWLTKDFTRENGYDRRVDPDFTKFTNWRDKPDWVLSWEDQVHLANRFYEARIDTAHGVPGRRNQLTSLLSRLGVPKQFMDCTQEERKFLSTKNERED